MATPETRRQLLAAVAACDDKKGEDTRIPELDPADSGLADFFLITSASNDRQVVAIADEIEMRLKKEFGLYPASVEGRRQAEWILLDYVDIVIHVFLQEKRAFYDIERLRKSARSLTAGEIDAQLGAELRAALAEKTRAVRGSAASPKAKKKAATGPASKSPATRTPAPKTPSAHFSTQGDSNVTAKPAKKAAKKAAAKSSFKPGKEVKAKPAVKAAPAKAAAKPAKKAAVKSVKSVATKPVGAVMGAEISAKGAQPPIVKCEDPDAPATVSAAAAKPAKKAAKKAAKKPLKQATVLRR
jgi:ribosome-associated protein